MTITQTALLISIMDKLRVIRKDVTIIDNAQAVDAVDKVEGMVIKLAQTMTSK